MDVSDDSDNYQNYLDNKRSGKLQTPQRISNRFFNKLFNN